MTKKEIIDNIARLNSQTWRDREEVRTEIGKLLSELKKSLEQEPCEDTISRRAAIDAAALSAAEWDGMYVQDINGRIREALEKLPSATPRQKIGRWEHGKEISREYRGQALVSIDYLDWHCSNCHCVVEQSIKPKWDYCPICGAKMQESEEV